MPTNKECHTYREELYDSINSRVKRWIFVLVVTAFASILMFVGKAVWTTTEKANATEVRRQEQKEAAEKAIVVQQKHHDGALGEIKDQIQRMDKKLDTVIERIYE